jgi:CrcB protein
MPSLLLVMLGGAFGAGARHLVGRWALGAFGAGWPYGTLIVNLAGGLAMGLLAGWLARDGGGGESARMLIGVGVLGGFTTFSAFSLEVVTMLERGDWLPALAYMLVSVIGSVVALAIGLGAVRVMA